MPVSSTSWKPGHSGNPAGRPPGFVSLVQKLAREHTSLAIEALVEALKEPRERVPAAVALLDRGWGKPVQPLENTGDQPLAVHFTWGPAHDQQATVTIPNASGANGKNGEAKTIDGTATETKVTWGNETK